ncbi:hypothetical protein F2P81_002772 [Scophthalmus maximus]|uniref:Uncharacterized protein n=1 Tax=Scophthalmus maximus TaxID=52904 RepID=A0A6A4TJM8_SCOMX|nr:hypothetical protein F2P81_002772 [Scophthalmus maximus]
MEACDNSGAGLTARRISDLVADLMPRPETCHSSPRGRSVLPITQSALLPACSVTGLYPEFDAAFPSSSARWQSDGHAVVVCAFIRRSHSNCVS